MTDHADKAGRKALAREWEQQRRAEAAASAPLSPAALAELFDWLDAALADGCDHSLRFTRAFVVEHGLPEESALEWLADHGGYCDCEVLANVEDAVS